jgi:sec-independent protein translocase protein TatC
MKLFASDAAEMPFLDHLEELRWRLIWSLGAVAVGAVVGFVLVTHFDVLGLLIEPIQPYLNGTKLKYLSPTEPFFITLWLAILVGILLALPVVVYHIWAFLAPALKPSERRAIVPSLYLGLVLFACGVAAAYYVVLPMTLGFTMGFQEASLEQSIVIGEYLDLVTRLLLAFGAVFELPVIVLILSALGLVTPQFLASKRRHAIVGITVLASVITPGDVVTVTLMMMVPMYALYELSIFLSRLVTRRRTTLAGATAEI